MSLNLLHGRLAGHADALLGKQLMLMCYSVGIAQTTMEEDDEEEDDE